MAAYAVRTQQPAQNSTFYAGKGPVLLVKFFERSLPVTSEEETLRQAMEAVFYARDPEGELPPNLLIVEKSFSPPDSEEEEERDRDPGLRYY